MLIGLPVTATGIERPGRMPSATASVTISVADCADVKLIAHLLDLRVALILALPARQARHVVGVDPNSRRCKGARHPQRFVAWRERWNFQDLRVWRRRDGDDAVRPRDLAVPHQVFRKRQRRQAECGTLFIEGTELLIMRGELGC